MRPHGHYTVDSQSPRAKAVCDRCGFLYQLSHLRWQFEWSGPKLQNLRIFVCQSCLDKPQPNLRTFVIPPDPQPVYNPRPEYYVADDNPMSALGAFENFARPSYGSRIGSLSVAGGLNAAMDGNVRKVSWQSACGSTATIGSSYAAYVGINWTGNLQPNASLLSSLQSPIITHSLSSVSIYAPIDRSFLGSSPTNFVVQYSPVDTALFGAWTTIASGVTAGTAGESVGITITSSMVNPLSQFHRVAFLGNGSDYISVSQATFSVAEVGGVGEQ